MTLSQNSSYASSFLSWIWGRRPAAGEDAAGEADAAGAEKIADAGHGKQGAAVAKTAKAKTGASARCSGAQVARGGASTEGEFQCLHKCLECGSFETPDGMFRRKRRGRQIVGPLCRKCGESGLRLRSVPLTKRQRRRAARRFA